jgi:hypothetical protein
MDSADIIVIVIFDSSRLIYGRNVPCWRQADLPSALSVRDRLSLHSRWMARRHIIRRSIMGLRSLTAVQAMPDGASRGSSGAGRERCITWDQWFVGDPVHDRYWLRIPDCRFVRRFEGRGAKKLLVWSGRREPCRRIPPEHRMAPAFWSARTTRPLPILVPRYAADRFIVTAPPVVG